MNWNKDQLRAIKYPNEKLPMNSHSAVVTAAAGSGKTALLVERVARIISDKNNPISADKIAILTFTNNAANEFRQRMTKAISALITESDNKDTYLESQLILFKSAPISTINAFCLSILRDNTDIFNLPVSFTIIDDVKSKLLKAEAIGNAMEVFYSDNIMFPPNDREQLFKSFSFDNDKELTESIEGVYNKLTSMADRDQFLSDCVNVYSSSESIEKNFLPFFLNDVEKQINILGSLSKLINDLATDIIERKQTDTDVDISTLNSRFMSFVTERYNLTTIEFKKVKQALSLKALNDFVDSLSSTPSIRESKNDKNVPNSERLISLRKNFISVYNGIKNEIKKFIPEISDNDIITKQYQTINTFVKLLRLYESQFTMLKRSNGYVDFSDCEQMLLDTLRTNDEFKNALKERYKCIIVDEFQDTNDIQYEIFKLISDDENNLFFVGDIKQSIYGFRGGNPRIMMNLSECNNTKYDTIPLNRNYRSRRSVIRTVNAMFAGLMTKEYGDVDYDNSAMLIYGADYPDPENKDYLSELHIIDGVDSEDDTTMAEAEYTANIIKNMVDNHFQVRESNTTTRDCTYGDFLVLLRSNTHSDKFKKAFEELFIPVDTDKGDSYLATEEISLIISLLKVIDNPMQDIELLKVLASPLYMMSAEELAKVRLGILGFPQTVIDSTDLTPIYDRYKNRALYACIKACSKPYSEENEQLRSKLSNTSTSCEPADELEKLRIQYSETCARFINDLSTFRDYKSSSSIEALINKIYNDTDFFSVIATYERSDQKIANVRRLLKYAADFERSGGGTLNEFLRYTDKVKENGSNFKDAKTADSVSDSVRIMTYHGSKGLEAPIVILPQLGKYENNEDRKKTLLFNRNAGIGIKHVDIDLRYSINTTARACISLAEKTKQRSEELRLLYVAMTRAREKLIMIGQYKVSDINDKLYTEYFTPYSALSDGHGRTISWILSSMLRYSEKVDFTAISEHRIKNRLKIIIPCIENTLSQVDVSDENIKTAEFNSETKEDEYAAKQIEQAINARYAFEEDTDARSKFTVTEIAHRLDEQNEDENDDTVTEEKFRPDYRFHLNKPIFMKNKSDKLTGPLLGNAYHAVMEFFPLEELTKNLIPDIEYIGKQLDILEEKKIISEVERNSVNDEAILKFFQSALGKRMLSSNGIEREYSIFAELAARDIGVDQNGDTIIQGRTDMFFYEEDGIVIVDYKSDKKETLIKRMDDYFTQLSIYRTVLPMLTGKQVKQIYIYSFSYGEAIEESEKEMWLNH